MNIINNGREDRTIKKNVFLSKKNEDFLKDNVPAKGLSKYISALLDLAESDVFVKTQSNMKMELDNKIVYSTRKAILVSKKNDEFLKKNYHKYSQSRYITILLDLVEGHEYVKLELQKLVGSKY